MAYPLDANTTPDAKQSAREADLVAETRRVFSELTFWRNNFATQWQECAELILPTYRNTFFYGNFNMPGEKKTFRQVDATGMLALSRFSAILDSLLTPRNMAWHQLEADNDYVNKQRGVKLWFEDTTRKLFKLRYAPSANFASQNIQNYLSLGAFGNAGMFIDQAAGMKGFRYRSVPLGELFIKENHQGLIDTFVRWFRLTARQANQQWPGKLPATMRPALELNSEQKFDFLHHVCPRADYDPSRIDDAGKKFHSIYVSIQGNCLMQEGGYTTYPLPTARYEQAPNEVYGRGPAMMVLPALKTLNAEKTTFLKVGHRTGDPVFLTSDDGIVGMSLRPGAMNKGGLNAEGKEMIKVLEDGKIQTTKEMMDEERNLINDAFLVTLFQIMTENPQMTATEVVERTNEKGILLAPTVGRQQGEYLGPMIDRELDLASAMGLLDPMPGVLREAKGEYHTVYTSPLSRAQRAQEVAGVMRSIEGVLNIVNATQNPAPLDYFDWDVIVPQTAEIQGVPASWMKSFEDVQKLRDARSQAQAQQQQIQALPAQAAMLKAHATMAKAGVQPQPIPGGAPNQ